MLESCQIWSKLSCPDYVMPRPVRYRGRWEEESNSAGIMWHHRRYNYDVIVVADLALAVVARYTVKQRSVGLLGIVYKTSCR